MTKTELASCVFLIVDDDEFSRAIITDALNHLGCQQIYQADNGASAPISALTNAFSIRSNRGS